MSEQTENDPADAPTDESGNKDSGVNLPERRLPRSIRFSESEWKLIEEVAKNRGMAAAELARHAAVGYASGRLATNPEGDFSALQLKIAAQVERIYNGVYLLATLKRDEMLSEGRQKEMEKIIDDARNSKDLPQDNAAH